MTGLPNVHPALVHVPIALLPLSVAFDVFAAASGRRDAATGARWTLWLGTLGAALAVVTGHAAADAVQPQISAEARALMATHHDVAMGVLAVAALLSLWRLRGPEPGWRTLYLIVATGLVAALLVVSDLGGRMVFLHGVAVHT